MNSWNATRRALERYVAGRLDADSVVAAVTAAYYRETGKGKRETGKSGTGGGERETLRPVVEVIERAAPGVVELAGSPDGPGFEIRVAERPFPAQYELELRRAAEAVLGAWNAGPNRGAQDVGAQDVWAQDVGAQHAAPLQRTGWASRLVRAILRLFNAST
ncbi:MAG TPA: hypothetical protein VIW28_10595 [Gemmatimonadales bacterium]